VGFLNIDKVTPVGGWLSSTQPSSWARRVQGGAMVATRDGRVRTYCAFAMATIGTLAALAVAAWADETCMSPYMAKIVGQADFVYVWNLGVTGVGDAQNKLVTVDVRPGSQTYGKVINTLPMGGRNEAHHSGLTDDRLYLWAGGLDSSKIFVFDIHTDPA